MTLRKIQDLEFIVMNQRHTITKLNSENNFLKKKIKLLQARNEK